ncbi:putative CYC2-like cyclin, putative,G1 cyclin CycE4 [Trypanosoma grayi]|uniref:putative CYC2-like cyclin, putative,G1 cyclin CycE4 n=1 Tax=Trypanosoma grayi TaxID=71804 RepID=UPI0004F47995|nr:putative CYC2-like cyclin, putative,G1 cyclin CycE4 [Trypanosoma grayi]KEG12118.1 putative CYC2-like cyclin, putative,G1 cyclin CycE4 [Trypanosoma grayi]
MDQNSTAVDVRSSSPRNSPGYSEHQAHTTGVATETAGTSSYGSRDTARRSLLVSMRATSTADEDAYTAAVSLSSTSHEWASSNGNLHSSHRLPSRSACGCGGAGGGSSHQSLSVNGTFSERGARMWNGSNCDSSGGTAEHLGVEDATLGKSRTSHAAAAAAADDARPVNHFHAPNNFSRSERCRHHHHHHHQDVGNATTTTTTTTTCSTGNNNVGSSHFSRGSPCLAALCGNPPQHRGGASASHYQQHHHSHHHHHHHHVVVGASRRSHRRRGFGAAAVEAIRSRTFTRAPSPKQVTLSPSLKCRKPPIRVGSVNEQEQRPGFQVPLPRSKSALSTTQDALTPGDGGEAMIAHSTAGSEFGSINAGENGSTAFLLSNIAPFYDYAIQQLIIECERRVANASEPAPWMTNRQKSCSVQTQQKLEHSVSTHSFDMQPQPVTKQFQTSPLHLPFAAHVRAREGEATPQQHGESGDSSCSPNAMDILRRGDGRREGEGLPTGVTAGSGLFTFLSEDTPELGATSAMVQQLIESIGLHISYGDAAPMVLIGALVYISRITMQSTSEYSSVTTANWYRLITVAILIATKMYVDGPRRYNEKIATAAGLTLKEMNKLELDFLFLADFDLLVKEEEVEAWAEWMDSIARRRDMATPLRTFIFGKSSCTPSNATTPLSSFAGDDMFIRSATHIPSGNWPSTPLSLTPANMTPKINAHFSPAVSKAPRFSQRLSMSFALDTVDKPPRPGSQLHIPLSPLPGCETPNLFLPSPLHIPLAPRKAERLFSVVHAPQEPLTPLSLRLMSFSVDAAGPPPLTPPEQQLASPVKFFEKSYRIGKGCNDSTHSRKAKQDENTPLKRMYNGKNRGRDFDGMVEEDEEAEVQKSPPHRVHTPLSPPNALAAAPPPPGSELYGHHHNHKNVNTSKSSHVQKKNSGEAVAARAAQATSCLLQPKAEMAAADSGDFRAPLHSRKGVAAEQHANGNGGRWKQVVLQVREVLGATRSFVRSTPLNVLQMDNNEGGAVPEHVRRDAGNYEYYESDEEDDHDGFEDDFEDDRDDIFARCHRLPTHSPPV